MCGPSFVEGPLFSMDRVKLAGHGGIMEAAVEFSRLKSLITLQGEEELPYSVEQRYQQRLATLRTALRSEQHAYSLGAILISIGALSDPQLNRALSAQRKAESGKLLGEILLDMSLVSSSTLDHALSIQRSSAHRTSRTSESATHS